MNKRKILVVSILLVFLIGIVGVIEGKQYLIKRYLAEYVPPPIKVRAEAALAERWESTVTAVGSLKAENGVDLATESSGVVKDVLFRGGEIVDAGTELISLIDDVDKASLKSLLAQKRLAEINFERDKKLLTNRAISQTDFDKTDAEMKDANAQIEKTEAIIARKHLRAPFSGRIGIPRVDVGEYISEGHHVVTLQALDTMQVNFHLPEKYLPYLKPGQRVHCRVHAYPEQVFDGAVKAIDAKIEANTRNILVRAAVPNLQLELLPGMFVSVEVIIEEDVPVVTVPESAISYNLYGDSVFVIEQAKNAEGKTQFQAHRRYISTGERRNGRVAVEGLEEGATVVSSGALKLEDGTVVTVEATETSS